MAKICSIHRFINYVLDASVSIPCESLLLQRLNHVDDHEKQLGQKKFKKREKQLDLIQKASRTKASCMSAHRTTQYENVVAKLLLWLDGRNTVAQKSLPNFPDTISKKWFPLYTSNRIEIVFVEIAAFMISRKRNDCINFRKIPIHANDATFLFTIWNCWAPYNLLIKVLVLDYLRSAVSLSCLCWSGRPQISWSFRKNLYSSERNAIRLALQDLTFFCVMFTLNWSSSQCVFHSLENLSIILFVWAIYLT